MKAAELLLGKDLAGFHIEKWNAVYGTDAEGRSHGNALGFFKDKSLAMAWGRIQHKSMGDPYVSPCYVLTKDGAVGIVIGETEEARLIDETDAKAVAMQAALKKLDPEERKLFGLE